MPSDKPNGCLQMGVGPWTPHRTPPPPPCDDCAGRPRPTAAPPFAIASRPVVASRCSSYRRSARALSWRPTPGADGALLGADGALPQGPQGPQGPRGPQGPQGPAAARGTGAPPRPLGDGASLRPGRLSEAVCRVVPSSPDAPPATPHSPPTPNQPTIMCTCVYINAHT